MRFRWTVLLLLTLPMLLFAAPTQAQYDDPITERADRFLLVENEDGSWDVIFSLQLQGDAQTTTHTAVLPLPGGLMDGLYVDTAYSLLQLQAASEPLPSEPNNPCEELFPNLAYGSLGPPYTPFWEATLVNNTVVQTDNADWYTELQAAGYAVSATQQATMDAYLAAETPLLVVQFLVPPDATPDESLGPDAIFAYSEMVRFTVPSRPSLDPTLLHNDNRDNELLIWVIADQPYTAANYPVVQPDFASFVSANEAATIGTGLPAGLIGGYRQFQDQYKAQLSQLLAANGGTIVVPQMALPLDGGLDAARSVSFRINAPEDLPMIGDLLIGDRMITRLYARLDRTALDPIDLIADPGLAPLDHDIRMRDYVVGADYYGCHTARPTGPGAAFDPTFDPATMSLYRDEWSGLAVVVPIDWVASVYTFTPDFANLEETLGLDFRFYSDRYTVQDEWPVTVWRDPSDPVTLDTVRAALRGERAPAMQVMIGFQGYSYEFPPVTGIAALLGLNPAEVSPTLDGATMYPVAPDAGYSVLGRGLLALPLVDEADPSGDVVRAAVAATTRHPFYASMNFEHTLFLKSSQNLYPMRGSEGEQNPFTGAPLPTDNTGYYLNPAGPSLLQIPFSNGAIFVRGGADSDFTIVMADEDVSIRVTDLTWFLRVVEDGDRNLLRPEVWASLQTYLASEYGIETDVASLLSGMADTRTMPAPLRYDSANRFGYVYITPNYLVVLEAENGADADRFALLRDAVRLAFAPQTLD